MYLPSQRYQALIREPMRPRSYARITLGVIDLGIRQDATISGGEPVWYAIPIKDVDDKVIDVNYATFETNGFPLDGSTNFLPEFGNVKTQGYVSKNISNAQGTFDNPEVFYVDFTKNHNLIGLSLDFAWLPPKEFKVTGYRNNVEVMQKTFSDNTDMIVLAELLFEEIDQLKFEFIKTQFPFNRVRLNERILGIAYVYTDTDIISISENHRGSMITTELPTSSLSFVIDNKDNRFSLDKETLVTTFFEAGQNITVEYGLDVDGVVEWVPSEGWDLQTWKVARDHLTCTATNIMTTLNETMYEKSVFTNRLINAEQMIKDILFDAGIAEYYITQGLDNIQFQSPIPVMTHAQALQTVAAMSSARLYIDKKGKINIKKRLQNVIYTFSDQNTATVDSDIKNLSKDNNINYATLETDGFMLDGTSYLLPTTNQYLQTAYTSKEISTDKNIFSDTPMIDIHFPVSDIFSIVVTYGNIVPAQIEISAWNGSAWVDKHLFDVQYQKEFYPLNYIDITKIRIIGVKTKKPYQRLHVNQVLPNNVSGFVLSDIQIYDYKDGEEKPLCKKLTAPEIVLESIVHLELYHATVLTNTGRTRYDHALAYNIVVAVSDPAVTIVQEHYAYVSYITLTSTESKEVTLILTGDTRQQTSINKELVLNNKGGVCPFSFPITPIDFTTVMDWMGHYLKQRIQFDFKTRGYPELELFDGITLENNNVFLANEITLKYNGALSGTVKLRKE